MDIDPSRRTQQLMHEAALLLSHAQSLEGALQKACASGALVLAAQGLSALVAELAAPQKMDIGQWQEMLKMLPETLQERRLLERALLTAEGELYPLHLRIEQQRTGRSALSTPLRTESAGLIATTASPADALAQLKSQMDVLRCLANSLREFSRFC